MDEFQRPRCQTEQHYTMIRKGIQSHQIKFRRLKELYKYDDPNSLPMCPEFQDT